MKKLALLLLGCLALCLPAEQGKIDFDLDAFDREGLLGPADGKRSVDYEFCIPDSEKHRREIHRIDSNIHFRPGSPGRIACGEGMLRCVGNTQGKDVREVLGKLAALEYVREIRRIDWE